MSRLIFLLMFLSVLATRQVDLSAETLRIDAEEIGTADAPPRSISDIAAVLERDRENLKAVEAAIGIAEQLPPEGAKSGGLAKFFRDRARQAQDAEKGMVSAARSLTTVLARPENQADPKLAAKLRSLIETLRSKRD